MLSVLVLRASVILLCLVGACAATAARDPGASLSEPPQEPVPIQSTYATKIVYGVAPKAPVERLRADCHARGGTLNTCGSPCPPGAAICADVCAVTCEGIKTPPPGASGTRTAEVALLDPEQKTPGPQRGCDTVVFIERPLLAAENEVESRLRALFAIEEERVEGLYNFIARTKSTLQLEDVQLAGETARVYLSGRISKLAGVCDNPRTRIQIEETARRAPGVRQVEILLNGKPLEVRMK